MTAASTASWAKELDAQIGRMRTAAQQAAPSSYAERMARLQALEQMVMSNKDRIADACNRDFGGGEPGRGGAYCILGDVWAGLNTLREVMANLHEWMQVEEVPLGMGRFPFNLMGRAQLHTKPLGVVLVLCPWNYPFHIPVSALGDVLGAGNRVVIKPSEAAPRASALLKELAAKHFDPDWVTVVTGGPDVAEHLTRQDFDHILYVGSTRIGRKVMQSAAENLTPVTLELGGKNPVIVCPDYDLGAAAALVATQKMENSGQICTGPDTAFCPPGQGQAFLAGMKKLYVDRWGPGRLTDHEQCCSLIHETHFQRTLAMLEDAEQKGASVVSLDPTGFRADPARRKVAPHAILNPGPEAICSKEECFGPVLVVREMGLEQAVEYINAHDQPLACYPLTNDGATAEMLKRRVRCGGMSINAIGMHTVVAALPFGGVGASGIGCYHGKQGFYNFSHRMACYEFKRSVLPNIHLPYAPKDVATIESLCNATPNLKLISRGILAAAALVPALWFQRSPWARGWLLAAAKALVRLLEEK